MRQIILPLLLVLGAASLSVQAQAQPQDQETRTATFAGGCFWCVEQAFDEVDGVLETTSGYTGGDQADPTYEAVSAGDTGHTESVEVVYDPRKVDYATLLQAFWHNIDPFAENRQFCDSGSQYRSAIFYHDAEQQRLAEASKAELAERFDRPIATQIVPAGRFWKAEAYHQNYYQKNPVRYRFYKAGCGRVERLKEVWGDQAGHPGK
ncbi:MULTISPECIES: peptide-methionine (S)-S-oxide reductase MsrA [unclassified Modicisalibacter]|uniref:peptide-methionine (S)-S-oxide reductase MsrA n=1 Tax=unclassified Modicisalibacter TaxID=2679913 RepID=UPI001CCBF63D|nr:MULTISPECIES: peptide-methionine (S)-S-oxide reductase MsrA [unclassified Modicisalibacter]MBZ9560072.1 peptide-methionine (S)-S-oxide reductase MsrA [Modicisalibacter sp. R2A 31.J]MBZ9575981.1 peptide-methionine (S)-S-oxide reductase MsrA [Modicisalibacter sp. MOD 31.J]